MDFSIIFTIQFGAISSVQNESLCSLETTSHCLWRSLYMSLFVHLMLLFVIVCLTGSFGELILSVTEISPWYLIDD